MQRFEKRHPSAALARARRVFFAFLALTLVTGAAAVADTTSPAEVSGVSVSYGGGDVVLEWSAVALDVNGQPETVDRYVVYRSGTHAFAGPSFLDEAASTSLRDLGAAGDGNDYYYLVSAIDSSGNEGWLRPSAIETPPVLSGSTAATTIDVSWTGAQPNTEVASYKLYYGIGSRDFSNVLDLGLATSHTFTSVPADTAYFVKVAAIDNDGNVSAFSNEFSAALNGTVDIRAHDFSHLCPWYGNCALQPGEVSRRGGQEILVAVDFPDGDWVNAEMTLRLQSDLCGPPTAPSKCGQGNPTGWDGWNPCGDPWDRTASVVLALDCRENGGNCYGTKGNIELLHPITPFGTDARPPDGSGAVRPATWDYDITPLAPLLKGRRYVGVYVATWVPPGWWATVDFHVSEDLAEMSPEPPAAGIIPVSFKDGGNVTDPTSVTIPGHATQVIGRLFTTGHGNDEFAAKTGQIQVNGTPVWSDTIRRTDCDILGGNSCTPGSCKDFNACGCPSCTYPRSGWCPGLISCHDNEPCDQDIDLTAALPAGGTYDVRYEITNIASGGSWANSLVIYYYTAP